MRPIAVLLFIIVFLFPNIGICSQAKVIVKAQEPVSEMPTQLPLKALPINVNVADITHKEIELKDILDITLKRLDNTITIFGILMTVIVTGISLGIAFISWQQNKEMKREIEKGERDLEKRFNELEKGMNLEDKIEKWRSSMGKDIEEKLQSIPKHVSQNVQELFQEKYEKEIIRLTRTLAEEALLLAPDLRGLLQGRLREMVNRLDDIFKLKFGDEDTKKMHDTLSDAIFEWTIIEQIFNSNIEEVKKGIQTLGTHPIPELYHYLKRFELRYKEDAEILYYIKVAKKEIEEKHAISKSSTP